MIKIIYEDNHLLVVEKPCNMLVQKDETNDIDLLSLLKAYLKEKYQKPGNVYLGLVHRLDRPVGGVMVFAKTSKAASRLSDMIRIHDFTKIYYAVIKGRLEAKGVFEDYLLKLDNNKTVIDPAGKYAKLDYELLEYKNDLSLVKINLYTGRSHQIRVQFASRNYPLWGDQKYNVTAVKKEQIALWAVNLSFKHPVTKEFMNFKSMPNVQLYPWCNFSKSYYE